ncbi:LysR substrate-binding domain-containing protein [Microbacterium oxydans]|jgi:DNA-binding transcriptional LysR family regulator|uniref:DNA-binding transcriptional LysR family regulator n=4 Tax=Microbacterium TaxID=33882 RepID=A0A7W7FHT5_9MICO|nr:MULTISPECIES: LysR substrate-binding domain-containing protein [Microbacterium]EIC06371.1 LysR substrate-binding protein [Microbacterium laevaniformans OR221]AUG28126.1 LysR family transcriptional regulator [Microbacterium hominis]MBB4665660.1 DNA-binding transcriptional LysR family regulator [Microbacterium marinum]MCW2162903.1 transcriptional regulator, LysR family [Microbacterium hydrothermale]PMC02101.1 LysR family transcriptional regulator [Microbacterium sp. UMB0228]
MDLQQLRAFLAVAEELHFGRAAERLHMAQPPISRGIQQLERELGARLFERSTRKVTLTSVGEALVAPAQEVLDALDRVSRVARAAGTGEIGHVRLAYAGASSNVMVGLLARAVNQNHPGIHLELLSQHFAQPAMQLLTRGDIDIALGRWDHIPAAVRTRVIAVEELVIAVPETHRLADAGAVSIAQFEGEPFVSLQPQTGTLLLERLRQMSRAAGFNADVVQHAPDSWTLMSLVSAEIGCSLTLSSVIDSIADPHLRFLRLTDDVAPVELRMAWLRDSDDRALHAVLRLSESVLPTPQD